MGLCFLLFVNYKFLKLFITPPKYTHDANSNNSKITNQNINNNNVGDHPVQITTATMVTTPSTANDVWSIPGPLRLPLFGTKWIYLWKYKMSKIHEVYRGESSQYISKKKRKNLSTFSWNSFILDFKREYGQIVLEVTTNGIPIVNLYNRQDIEKVLRFPSKYPFRPPTEIVAFYRRMRPDRYASTGITNEYVYIPKKNPFLKLNIFISFQC